MVSKLQKLFFIGPINFTFDIFCEIPLRLERGTKHLLEGCRNFSLIDAF